MTIATGLAVALSVATTASAEYVGSVIGLDQESEVASLTVAAGESFTGAIKLDGPGSMKADFALFRLVFSVSNLEYDTGWYDWSTPFTTGGVDDYSSPGFDSSGVIDGDTAVELAGYRVVRNVSGHARRMFGRGQCIVALDQVRWASSDGRGDGCAAGY